MYSDAFEVQRVSENDVSITFKRVPGQAGESEASVIVSLARAADLVEVLAWLVVGQTKDPAALLAKLPS